MARLQRTLWSLRSLCAVAILAGPLGCGQLFPGGAPAGEDATSGTTPEDDEPVVVPVDPDELTSFLRNGDYGVFPAESSIHPPQGPHGRGGIRVFFEPTLRQSLDQGALEHPVNAAAVAELFDVDGSTFIGWAVSVKISAASDGGNGWYWYEAAATGAAGQVAEGAGLGLCTSCHAGGEDFILSP